MEQVTVKVLDDITGEEGASTTEFALDGVSFEIDLTEANRQKLKDAFAGYITAGRKTGGGKARMVTPRGTGVAKPDREQLRAVREWARRHGLAVSNRGRIASLVQLAYNENNPELARTAMGSDAQPVAAG